MSRRKSRSSQNVLHLATRETNIDICYESPHQQHHPKPLKIRLEDLKTIDPLTQHQADFINHYNHGETFIVLHGCPGSGKSFLAIYKALEEILDKSSIYDKLIIIRSSVPSREVGHLPGDLDEKTSILAQPYISICSQLFNRHDAYSRLVEQKYVEFTSTSYLRGMTFDNAIILVDEIQNCSFPEITTIIGRIGINSKIILCGDYRQNDLVRRSNDQSGLNDFLKIASNMKSFRLVEFGVEDIVRSGLVKEWILACDTYFNQRNNLENNLLS